MKINVAKSGIMHIRKNTVERTTMEYTIDDEEIPLTGRYKYLGCMLDEFLELKDMIEDRVVSGKLINVFFGGLNNVVWGRGMGVPSRVWKPFNTYNLECPHVFRDRDPPSWSVPVLGDWGSTSSLVG